MFRADEGSVGARLARPDLQRAVCKLASHVSKWTRNDDRRVKRLMEYMKGTCNLQMRAFVTDLPGDLELWLFVDADLAGDQEDTKSSSGGVSGDCGSWDMVSGGVDFP